MRFIDHLSKEQIRKVNQLRHLVKDNPSNDVEIITEEITINRNVESFSRREIEDLMGTKRDTYKRVRGAVRRR